MATTKTLKSLIEECQALADETFDNKQWVDWLNSGLDDIAAVLYIDKKISINNSGLGVFQVPDDLLSIIRLEGSNSNLRILSADDDLSTGYHIVDNTFVLQNDSATTLSLWYYRRPAYMSTTSITTPVDIPDNYTRALVYFACAQGMLKEDEDDRYASYIGEFNKAKSLIHQSGKAKKAGRVGQWQVIR